MVHNNEEVLDYWNQEDVESMYDKYLIGAEIALIKSLIPGSSKILDAGCGEGEGTLQYASLPGVSIDAVDFSETRLKKASENLSHLSNVTLKKVDFLGSYDLEGDYDIIISQRFLINLMEWELQKKVILDLLSMLKKGGRFLMLEGSVDGTEELNDLRSLFRLPPIPVKWHNLFFKESELDNLFRETPYKIKNRYGLGEYFFLTRGLRPWFDKNLDWESDFNRISATSELKSMVNFNTKFSRLRLWEIEK